MVGPFAVDGYDVVAPLDAAGGRWRAICLTDGQAVVLRRWVGAAERLTDVRRRAALWGSAVCDGVVPVRDVLTAGADLVVVSDLGGDPLDLVLSRWTRLSPGQVVTLTVGIGRVLEGAHKHGLAHGRLDASAVVLDADGRPLLTDFVFADRTDPVVDVAALVAMASSCLQVDAPAALVAALDARVEAHELVDRALSAAPAEPLTARIATPLVVAQTRQKRGFGLRPAVGLTIAVAVLAVVMGMWWGRDAPAAGAPAAPVLTPSTTVSATPAPAPAMGNVVRALERRRIHALTHADVIELANVDRRGTALWRKDSRDIAHLTAARAHLRGLRVRVTAAHVIAVQASRAVVHVVDALSSYDVVDARGRVVAHHASRPARPVELVLVQDNGQWRIRAARAVSR